MSLVTTFERCFLKLQCFHYQIFIATFRFYAIPGIIETQLMLHALCITSKHNKIQCESGGGGFHFWRRALHCGAAKPRPRSESSKLIPFIFVSFPNSGMLMALGGGMLGELKEVTLPHLPAMTAEKTERTSVLTVKCQRGEGTAGTEGSRPGESHF